MNENRKEVLEQIAERLHHARDELKRIESMKSNPATEKAKQHWRASVHRLEQKYNHVKNLPDPPTKKEWLKDVIGKLEVKPKESRTRYHRDLITNYKNQLSDLEH